MTHTNPTTLAPDEEKRLVQRLKDGDTRALEPIWRAYAKTVYKSVIYPNLPVRDLAEEVLSNTFLKAYERIGSYTWQNRGLLPWLKTIARNLATDVHRRHQRTEKFCKGYGDHVDLLSKNREGHDRPDRALSAREESRSTRQRVRAVLESGKLNERYRKVIELRIYQEMEREACAEQLGIRVGTLDVLFHRAIKRFEAVYRKMYGAPSDEQG